jgi:hypothetical protein
MPDIFSESFTVASGAATSSAVQIEHFDIVGIQVPTIDSATLKVQGSCDGGSNYADIYDGNGTQVLSWVAGTGNRIIDARDLAAVLGCTHIRIVLGANQTALRTFTLVQKNPY